MQVEQAYKIKGLVKFVICFTYILFFYLLLQCYNRAYTHIHICIYIKYIWTNIALYHYGFTLALYVVSALSMDIMHVYVYVHVNTCIHTYG